MIRETTNIRKLGWIKETTNIRKLRSNGSKKVKAQEVRQFHIRTTWKSKLRGNNAKKWG